MRYARRASLFFQAEDGIRDGHVTGVQTCALPIWTLPRFETDPLKYHLTLTQQRNGDWRMKGLLDCPTGTTLRALRSEERRVGKASRSRGSGDAQWDRECTAAAGQMSGAGQRE